jgi:hypothetical protein
MAWYDRGSTRQWHGATVLFMFIIVIIVINVNGLSGLQSKANTSKPPSSMISGRGNLTA